MSLFICNHEFNPPVTIRAQIAETTASFNFSAKRVVIMVSGNEIATDFYDSEGRTILALKSDIPNGVTPGGVFSSQSPS